MKTKGTDAGSMKELICKLKAARIDSQKRIQQELLTKQTERKAELKVKRDNRAKRTNADENDKQIHSHKKTMKAPGNSIVTGTTVGKDGGQSVAHSPRLLRGNDELLSHIPTKTMRVPERNAEAKEIVNIAESQSNSVTREIRVSKKVKKKKAVSEKAVKERREKGKKKSTKV